METNISLDPVQDLANKLRVPKRAVEVILKQGEPPTIDELKKLCNASSPSLAVVADLHRIWFDLCQTTYELSNLFTYIDERSLLRAVFIKEWCIRFPHLTWEDFHELKKLAPHGSDLEHALLAREIELFLESHSTFPVAQTIAQSGHAT